MDVVAGQNGSYKYVRRCRMMHKKDFENMLPFIALLDIFLT